MRNNLPLSRIRVALFSTVTLLLAACGNPERIADITKAANSHRANAAKAAHASRADEEKFAEIASEVPTFAGYFLDSEGHMAAFATDTSDFAAVSSAIRRRLASGRIRARPSETSGTIRVSKADFTFQQLSDWRDSVFDKILGRVKGVISDDLDEAHNRVTLGLQKGQEAALEPVLLQRLGAMGIPATAIRFESQTISHLTGSPPTSLSSRADDLVGGLRITYLQTDGSGFSCSIGYPVGLSDGSHAFITASHCSRTYLGGPDGTPYFQTNPFNSSDSVGYELYDPAGGECPVFWPCSVYRFSDANIVKVSSRGWRRGTIARPDTRQTSHQPGTLNLDTAKPYLYVTASTDDIFQNAVYDKVGATTGWTVGSVSNTCQDVWLDGPRGEVIRCSYMASMYADHGDSGGPVFAWDGQDGITAAGIVFGGTDEQTLWFSKWMNVRNELTGGPFTYLDYLTDVSIGSESMSGTVSSQHPSLSWNVLSTTNSILSTTYSVWRVTFDGSTFTDNSVVFSSTSATSYTDNNAFVRGTAYTSPPSGPYVSYHVTAYNSGQSTSSQTLYYSTVWQ